MDSSDVDYVVIGGGTAGCIVASRLSADPSVRVALLEYGGLDSNPSIYERGLNPMFSLWDPKGAENWGHRTVAQTGLGGRSIDIARGKVLGGCSAVNAMIYIRGHRQNFDAWQALGNREWGYDDVLPYFKKSETFYGPPSPFHGDSGPLAVTPLPSPSAASRAFVEAAAIVGAPGQYNDFNGENQEAGAGVYQFTRTPDGVRVTAGSAFVHPIIERNNFTLTSRARVTRLLFQKGRAVGVEYVDANGAKATLRAGREVVLCGGSFETPKLLMLSGIGPAEHLAAHDLTLVQDLPGVGQNLQDHMLLGVGFESLLPLETAEVLAEAGLFTWTRPGQDSGSPNLQYFFGPVQFVAPEYQVPGPGFTFAPIVAQPRSRGTVTLASRDPSALPRVDPRYLSDEEDVAVLEYGIRYARELVQTKPFEKLRGRELAPGKDVTTSSGLRDYIRKVAGTVWHPVGTCRMGNDREAVVDDRLRVRGVQGLRVADASVMPRIVNGNPNAAVMMIAEKAADLIRQDRATSH